ncbi:hypothetical protein [Sphingomonas sp.]|uniref:hypothetical protein n=1 Tax=Sphingomonas sp. TaxID=28214 RepID=UPI003B00FDA6
MRLPAALFLVLPLALAACAKDAEITAIGGSVGKEINRTGCPALAVPADTGDVTLFDPPASRDARAIDVVATLTDLTGACDTTQAANLATTASFRVDARRSSAAGPRDVVLPYYAVVMRGGDQVVSKSVSQVLVHFDAGKLIASTNGQASASIDRAQAMLPQAIRDRIGKKRKAEDADASLDPMNDPQVRAALAKASFELLVGFQLTDAQLAYNATR